MKNEGRVSKQSLHQKKLSQNKQQAQPENEQLSNPICQEKIGLKEIQGKVLANVLSQNTIGDYSSDQEGSDGNLDVIKSGFESKGGASRNVEKGSHKDTSGLVGLGGGFTSKSGHDEEQSEGERSQKYVIKDGLKKQDQEGEEQGSGGSEGVSEEDEVDALLREKLAIQPQPLINKGQYSLKPDMKFGWKPKIESSHPPIPLYFDFIQHPMHIYDNDELHQIMYLGFKPQDSYQMHKAFSNREEPAVAYKSYEFKFPDFYDQGGKFQYDETLSKYLHLDMHHEKQEFEGMNPELYDPEINDQYPVDIEFNSKFESGNLDMVVRSGKNSYDCFMRADSNTYGHIQWFHFSLKHLWDTKTEISEDWKPLTIRLNLVNFTKKNSLYQQGMRPVAWSLHKAANENTGWIRVGDNIKYGISKVSRGYPDQCRKIFYSLSFDYTFHTPGDTVYFAYSVPYTFSMLNQFLKGVQNIQKQMPEDQKVIEITSLCQSLSGIEIPLLTVTNFQQVNQDKKKVILICGRVHPGETHASWIMHGFLKLIISSSKVAQELRNRVIFKIIPITNPDGVVLGNYRSSLIGRDINRCFHSPNAKLSPETSYIRKLIQEIQHIDKDRIMSFIDIHSHSNRKSTFIYGPYYPLHSSKYMKIRVIPKLLSERTQMFRYYSCKFRIEKYKENCARIALWRDFGITNSFTIESSFHGYIDKSRQTIPFTEKNLQQFGETLCHSLFEYCVILEEDKRQKFELAKQLRQKRKSKRKTINEILSGNQNREKEEDLGYKTSDEGDDEDSEQDDEDDEKKPDEKKPSNNVTKKKSYRKKNNKIHQQVISQEKARRKARKNKLKEGVQLNKVKMLGQNPNEAMDSKAQLNNAQNAAITNALTSDNPLSDEANDIQTLRPTLVEPQQNRRMIEAISVSSTGIDFIPIQTYSVPPLEILALQKYQKSVHVKVADSLEDIGSNQEEDYEQHNESIIMKKRIRTLDEIYKQIKKKDLKKQKLLNQNIQKTQNLLGAGTNGENDSSNIAGSGLVESSMVEDDYDEDGQDQDFGPIDDDLSSEKEEGGIVSSCADSEYDIDENDRATLNNRILAVMTLFKDGGIKSNSKEGGTKAEKKKELEKKKEILKIVKQNKLSIEEERLPPANLPKSDINKARSSSPMKKANAISPISKRNKIYNDLTNPIVLQYSQSRKATSDSKNSSPLKNQGFHDHDEIPHSNGLQGITADMVKSQQNIPAYMATPYTEEQLAWLEHELKRSQSKIHIEEKLAQAVGLNDDRVSGGSQGGRKRKSSDKNLKKILSNFRIKPDKPLTSKDKRQGHIQTANEQRHKSDLRLDGKTYSQKPISTGHGDRDTYKSQGLTQEKRKIVHQKLGNSTGISSVNNRIIYNINESKLKGGRTNHLIGSNSPPCYQTRGGQVSSQIDHERQAYIDSRRTTVLEDIQQLHQAVNSGQNSGNKKSPKPISQQSFPAGSQRGLDNKGSFKYQNSNILDSSSQQYSDQQQYLTDINIGQKPETISLATLISQEISRQQQSSKLILLKRSAKPSLRPMTSKPGMGRRARQKEHNDNQNDIQHFNIDQFPHLIQNAANMAILTSQGVQNSVNFATRVNQEDLIFQGHVKRNSQGNSFGRSITRGAHNDHVVLPHPSSTMGALDEFDDLPPSHSLIRGSQNQFDMPLNSKGEDFLMRTQDLTGSKNQINPGQEYSSSHNGTKTQLKSHSSNQVFSFKSPLVLGGNPNSNPSLYDKAQHQIGSAEFDRSPEQIVSSAILNVHSARSTANSQPQYIYYHSRESSHALNPTSPGTQKQNKEPSTLRDIAGVNPKSTDRGLSSGMGGIYSKQSKQKSNLVNNGYSMSPDKNLYHQQQRMANAYNQPAQTVAAGSSSVSKYDTISHQQNANVYSGVSSSHNNYKPIKQTTQAPMIQMKKSSIQSQPPPQNPLNNPGIGNTQSAPSTGVLSKQEKKRVSSRKRQGQAQTNQNATAEESKGSRAYTPETPSTVFSQNAKKLQQVKYRMRTLHPKQKPGQGGEARPQSGFKGSLVSSGHHYHHGTYGSNQVGAPPNSKMYSTQKSTIRTAQERGERSFEQRQYVMVPTQLKPSYSGVAKPGPSGEYNGGAATLNQGSSLNQSK